ncbi:MAG: hypothetical protein ACD_16C00131G0006 [uncultured bacterium]|nr:MAG: hypothetical protein ACD_16C00131G0006 [uncultured bacterium]
MMKSVLYTLVVLFGVLTVAQAANKANESDIKPVVAEEQQPADENSEAPAKPAGETK